MPSIYRFARPAVIALVLMVFPVSLRAENREHTFELGGGLNYVHFDGDTNINYTTGPYLLFGFNITKRHGVELGGTFLTATSDSGPSVKTDVGLIRAGYTYNAYPRSKVVSFFRAGLGRFAINPERDPDAGRSLEENDARLMVYAGGGVRFFMNDWVGIRLSATLDAIDLGNGIGHLGTQTSGELGVIFLIGGRDAADVPAGEPGTEKEPAEPEAPND